MATTLDIHGDQQRVLMVDGDLVTGQHHSGAAAARLVIEALGR